MWNLPADLAHGCLCDLRVCRHPVCVSCRHRPSADRLQRLGRLGWDATLFHSSSLFITLRHSPSLFFTPSLFLNVLCSLSLSVTLHYWSLFFFPSLFFSPLSLSLTLSLSVTLPCLWLFFTPSFFFTLLQQQCVMFLSLLSIQRFCMSSTVPSHQVAVYTSRPHSPSVFLFLSIKTFCVFFLWGGVFSSHRQSVHLRLLLHRLQRHGPGWPQRPLSAALGKCARLHCKNTPSLFSFLLLWPWATFAQPSKDSALFPAAVASRALFVPLLMLCNVENSRLAVVFSHDAAFVAINALFSFSNGYLATLCMAYAPQWVLVQEFWGFKKMWQLQSSIFVGWIALFSCSSPSFFWTIERLNVSFRLLMDCFCLLFICLFFLFCYFA